jgi:hypothetical protein
MGKGKHERSPKKTRAPSYHGGADSPSLPRGTGTPPPETCPRRRFPNTVNRVGYFSLVTWAGVACLLFSFDGACVQPAIVLMQKATRQQANRTLRNMEFPSQE